MGLIDTRNEFGSATAIFPLTQGAAWQNILATIDRGGLGAIGATAAAGTPSLNDPIDIGGGKPTYLVIRIAADIDVHLNGFIQFRLVSDTDNDPPHASTSTVHWTGPSIATNTTPPATLLAGVVLAKIALPIEQTYERFLGLQVLLTTGNSTAGALNAYLTPTPELWQPLADGQAD